MADIIVERLAEIDAGSGEEAVFSFALADGNMALFTLSADELAQLAANLITVRADMNRASGFVSTFTLTSERQMVTLQNGGLAVAFDLGGLALRLPLTPQAAGDLRDQLSAVLTGPMPGAGRAN